MTQLDLFAPRPKPIAPWIEASDVIAARMAKCRARAAWETGPTRTQLAQGWLRAARWWPAGSKQREDFAQRAREIIGA